MNRRGAGYQQYVSSKKTYCEFTAEENMTSNKHDKTINQSLQRIKIKIIMSS